jgi:WD40 repeat protein
MDDSDEHVAAIREVRAASAPSNWAIVTRDGQVSTWTLGSTHWRPLWRAGLATSLSVVDGPAAPTLVIGTADGVLHFCDSTTGAATHDPVPAGSPVLALAPAAGAAAVVVGGGSGAVGLWSVERRQWLQRPVPVLTTPVRSLCWLDSPAGAVVACGGDDGTIALVDVATWTGRGTLHLDERAWVWALCRLPVPGAAARLVSAGGDHRVTVWDPLLAEPVGEPLLGHTDQVRAVTAVARSDGRVLLATGGQDGVLCLWHPDTTRLVHRIPLGVSICDLAVGSGNDDTARRTDGGALIAVGTRTGTIAVDVNAGLFG